MSIQSWRLKSFGKIAPSPHWRMRSHRHPDPELIVVFRGVLHVREPDGTAHTGRAGDVFIYPGGCWHEEESDRRDPVETMFFGFGGQTGARIASLADRDGRIRSLSRWIWDSRLEGTAESATINQTFFAAINVEFQRLCAPSKSSTAFAEVRRFAFENLARKITVDDLASEAHMSKFHFIRQYRRQTGQSPMADVRMMRINEARHLIETTNLPLKAVADMVGFANEYQLSASMKKYAGQRPGWFRKG